MLVRASRVGDVILTYSARATFSLVWHCHVHKAAVMFEWSDVIGCANPGWWLAARECRGKAGD